MISPEETPLNQRQSNISNNNKEQGTKKFFKKIRKNLTKIFIFDKKVLY